MTQFPSSKLFIETSNVVKVPNNLSAIFHLIQLLNQFKKLQEAKMLFVIFASAFETAGRRNRILNFTARNKSLFYDRQRYFQHVLSMLDGKES